MLHNEFVYNMFLSRFFTAQRRCFSSQVGSNVLIVGSGNFPYFSSCASCFFASGAEGKKTLGGSLPCFLHITSITKIQMLTKSCFFFFFSKVGLLLFFLTHLWPIDERWGHLHNVKQHENLQMFWKTH